jgi:hypothetical protein
MFLCFLVTKQQKRDLVKTMSPWSKLLASDGLEIGQQKSTDRLRHSTLRNSRRPYDELRVNIFTT